MTSERIKKFPDRSCTYNSPLMNSEKFITVLNQISPLKKHLTDVLVSEMREIHFHARDILIHPGQIPAGLYFIDKGISRGYENGSKNKMSRWFRHEGELLILQGLFVQIQSEEYVEFVSSSTLLLVPVSILLKSIETVPGMSELCLALLEDSISKARKRELLLRIPEAKARYNFLAENESYLLREVPYHLIASYLNITKETFSRIHKGMRY